MRRKGLLNFFIFSSGFLVMLLFLSDIASGQPVRHTGSFSESNTGKNELIIRFKSDKNISTGPENALMVSDLIKNKKIQRITSMAEGINLKSRFAPGILNDIYKLELSAAVNPDSLIRYLRTFDNIAYVEPQIRYELFYIPNDPEAIPDTGTQVYLDKINAYAAWDISQGSPSILVGVIDTGIDTSHTDLQTNYYRNLSDPINGLDDDGDGYIDNYYGWDFADDDFDISADFDQHGTSVAGVSSGDADNGLGIAGIGFNTSFLPLKIFKSSNNEFNNGFEAILYAAQKGCKVIVLSWGSADSYSQFGQDIVNYVVREMDVVVVAAAGNTYGDIDFFPASFENVVSVGAVNEDDELATWGTYSNYVDVMAQGTNVFTTMNNNQFGFENGSSFSAPQVAGVAALIRSKYPQWNASQVMEQIRVTSDDIYGIGTNGSYLEKMGKGRLNAYKALTDSSQSAVRATNIELSNGIGNFMYAGDTIRLTLDLISFLKPVEDLNIHLSVQSGYASIINPDLQIPSLNPMDTFHVIDVPFIVTLNNELPLNEKLKFRLGFEGFDYSDYQYFEFISSGPYVEFDNQIFKITVGNNGTMGYYDNEYQEGIGLLYNNEKILDFIGLMISLDKDSVIDNAIYDFQSGIRTNDFVAAGNMTFNKNSLAEYDLRTVFSTDSLNKSKLNVTVQQKFLTKKDAQFIINEYRIINNGVNNLDDLQVGLFADINVGLKNNNTARWSMDHSLGYVNDQDKSKFVGIFMTGGDSTSFYALDIGNENNNVSEISGMLTDSMKHHMMSDGLYKLNAGILGKGNDVGITSGMKIIRLGAKSTRKIAAIIVAGNDSTDLINQLNEGVQFYNMYLESPPITDYFEVCSGDDASINPSGGVFFEFYSDPHMNDLIAVDSIIYMTQLVADTSIYIVNVDNEIKGDINQVKITISSANAEFEYKPDSVFLVNNESVTVDFTDRSVQAVTWQWDFGNGYKSDLQNPKINFESAGNYIVSLTITNESGCIDQVQKQLPIYVLAMEPNVYDSYICLGEKGIIFASNSDSIAIYTDFNLSETVYIGSRFESDPLLYDTIFYVTNLEGDFPSNPVKVEFKISEPNGSIQVLPDTVRQSWMYSALIFNEYPEDNKHEWTVNDSIISSESRFSYNYTNYDTIKVHLVIMDSLGCNYSVSRNIIPRKSLQPVIEPVSFCFNSTVVIQDLNSATIIIYNDQNKDSVVYRGKAYISDSLMVSTKFYVAGIDSLLESELVVVMATLSDNPAGFEMMPDTLNLQETNRVDFVSTGDEVKRVWDFEFAGLDTIINPYRYYYDQGRYGIKLTTWDSLGCISSYSDSLTVLSVTSLNEFFLNQIMVYPNPAQSQIFIDNISQYDQIYFSIYSLQGDLVFSGSRGYKSKRINVPFGNFKKGIYILEISDGNKRILIKKIFIL